jgi:hypothetical protein
MAAVVNKYKEPLEHYYLSHSTFNFPCDRFLRQAVVYSCLPDRKVGFYLMSNFENKYVINLFTRLKLFWVHQLGSIRDHTFGYKLKSKIVNKLISNFREPF